MKRIYALSWYIITIITTSILGYPLLWLIYSPFKTNKDIFKNPWSLPTYLDFSSFKEVLSTGNFMNSYINSLIITIISVAFILLFSSMAAYVFSKFEFKGKEFVFFAFLGGLMVPQQVVLIPLYILFRSLGLLDTLTSTILVYITFGLAVSIFILKNFFDEIPRELEDAAKVDGCVPLKIYWSIIIPMAKPALLTVGIYNAVIIWNEFIFALIFLSSPEKRTIPLGIWSFSNIQGINVSATLAALNIATFPLLIIYFIFQKKIISGMMAGALKG